jgi:hypothetical protein
MSKRSKNQEKGDEIFRAFLRIFPTLPQVFRRVYKRIENFDYRQPKTVIEKIKKDVEGLPSLVVGNDKVIRKIVQLLAEASFDSEARRSFENSIRWLKQEAATDSRYSEILRLMGESDARIPFISILVSLRHADPLERLSQQCEPVNLINQAEALKGEARANATLLALGLTVERVYRFYLISIWELSYFRNEEMPPQDPPATGTLLKEVQRRLPDYPHLVEPDAVWMRNSAVHNPCEYNIQTDSVVMWDKNIPRSEVKIDVLLAMVRRIYLVSAITMQRVAQLYLLRNLFLKTGLIEDLVSIMPDALSGDSARQQAAEEHFLKKSGEVVEPMRKFFETNQ